MSSASPAGAKASTLDPFPISSFPAFLRVEAFCRYRDYRNGFGQAALSIAKKRLGAPAQPLALVLPARKINFVSLSKEKTNFGRAAACHKANRDESAGREDKIIKRLYRRKASQAAKLDGVVLRSKGNNERN